MSAATWALLAFTALLGAARIFVCLTGIEPVTGFYARGLEGFAVAQNLLFAVGIAVLALLAARLPREARADVAGRAKPMGILLAAGGALTGVSLAARFALGLARITKPAAPFADSLPVQALDLTASLLGMAAAVSFVSMGLRLLRGGVLAAGLWIAALPALWMTADVVTRFLRYVTVASISAQTLEVTALCFAAMFWLGHARVAAASVESSPRRVRLWALLFAVIILPLCAGELAAFAAGRSSMADMPLSRLVYLLLFGVYAAVWSTCVTARPAEGAAGGTA